MLEGSGNSVTVIICRSGITKPTLAGAVKHYAASDVSRLKSRGPCFMTNQPPAVSQTQPE